MALLEPNLNPTPRELRLFGLIWFPAFLALIGGLVLARTGSIPIALAIWAGALVVSAAGLLAPKFTRALYLAWMYAVYPIGWTVSHVVMAATFYLVVAPIGIAMSLARRDALKRRRDDGAETYWVRSDSDDDVRHYLRQF